MRKNGSRFFEPSPLLRELQILVAIDRNPGASQNALAEIVGLSAAMMSYYLRALNQKGLITARERVQSKRSYDLTDEGRSRMESLSGGLASETGCLLDEFILKARRVMEQVASEGVRRLGLLAGPAVSTALSRAADSAGVEIVPAECRVENGAGVTALDPSEIEAVLVAEDPTRNGLSVTLELLRSRGVPIHYCV